MMEALLSIATFLRVEDDFRTLRADIDRPGIGVHVIIKTPATLRARDKWTSLSVRLLWGGEGASRDLPTAVQETPRVREL